MEFFTDGYDCFEENSTSIVTYEVNGVKMTEVEFPQRNREKYIENPPVGFTAREISRMRDNDILDMDYFLNK